VESQAGMLTVNVGMSLKYQIWKLVFVIPNEPAKYKEISFHWLFT